MDSALREKANTALETVSENYLAKTHNDGSDVAAQKWQPKKSTWTRVQSLTGWLPGISTHSSTVDGHELHYWQIGTGDGVPVVLVHGFGASKENWISLIPALFNRRTTLYVVDLPGFGQSTFKPEASYRYGAQAERLAEWSARLGLRPARWVGSSMGGAICATLAANHPERVRTITLMNAGGMGSERFSTMETELIQGQNPLIPQSRKDVKRLFRLTTYRHRGVFSRVMPPAIWRDMTHRLPVSRTIFRHMLTPETPVPDLLDKIRCPVHVLWGEEDEILDVSCAYRYGQLLPEVEVDILHGVGHLPMLEAPMKTASRLKGFWLAKG